jgi:hypothetical protein
VNTLKLPRADMDTIVYALEFLKRNDGWLVTPLLNDINAQLDKQEY